MLPICDAKNTRFAYLCTNQHKINCPCFVLYKRNFEVFPLCVPNKDTNFDRECFELHTIKFPIDICCDSRKEKCKFYEHFEHNGTEVDLCYKKFEEENGKEKQKEVVGYD